MDSLFSQTWYRVKDLKPSLRSHIEIHRHRYRNRTWYVIQDHAKGNFHRFTPEANYIIGQFDGKSRLDDIWKSACEVLGDDMPTQDEVINLLSRLHEADVLQTDMPPDIQQLVDRHHRSQRRKFLSRLKSPLAIKIPLFDPERFLSATIRYVKPFFSKWGMLGWCLLTGYALVQAAINFSELTENISDQVLATENIFLLWLLYPVIKLIHEFGHAWAVKRWGGEVHEMGVMLLVLMPLPYVDASSSAAFRDKRKRMLVSAAGMVVELVLASLAMIVWLNVEPGIVRSMAFNVMLIAGVSTLVFNGNPLLRFDAYYILSDYLEIPNLGTKANQYFGYLLKRYLLGIKDLDSPVEHVGGGAWLLGYAVTSFIYRLFVMIFIALFVAGKYFFIGVLLAIFAVYSMLLSPVVRIVAMLFKDPALRRKKRRIVATTAAIFIGIFIAVAIIPYPLVTMAEGVVWIPEHSQIRVRTAGFVKTVTSHPGSRVKKGDLLLQCEEPEIQERIDKLRAELREFEARYRAAYADRVQARVLQEEITRVKGELASAREKFSELSIKSPANGRLVMPYSQDLNGKFLSRGNQLGFVIPDGSSVIRVVIRQDDIANIRSGYRKIDVVFASNTGKQLRARMIREVPNVSRELPSLVLGKTGGGKIALDPTDPRGVRAYSRVYQFDLEIDSPVNRIGERVYVRFEHNAKPLVWRWYFSIRRLFLRQFDV